MRRAKWIGRAVWFGLWIVLCASTFSWASTDLSLNVPAHVYPGTPIEVRISAREVKGLQLTLFRIDDPEKYILESRKGYFFSMDTWRPKRPLNEQEKWQNIKFSFFQSLRVVASRILAAPVKETLKNLLGIQGPIGRRPIEITAADYRRNTSQLKSWWEDIKYEKGNDYAYQAIHINPLEPGVYLLVGAGGGREARVIFSVARLSLISKTDSEKMILFAQDRKDGAPQPNIHYRLLRQEEVIGDGTSDAQGLWVWPGKDTQDLTILAQQGKEFAFLNVYPPYGGSDNNLDAFVYTERPLYKPGQRVYFKAILRERLADGYISPQPGEKVTATLSDYRDNVYDNRDLVSDVYGTTNSWFDLPSSIEEGSYLIQVTWKGREFYRSVTIENYEKPVFEVAATTDKETYANEDQVTVHLAAQYYSGQPLTPAQFRYQVFRYPVYSWAVKYSYDMVEEGNGTLDASGKGELQVVPKVTESAYWYEVRVNVFDAASRTVEKVSRFKALMGDFALLLRSDRYFCEVNRPLHFAVEARDAEEKKVDVGKAYATINRLNWNKEQNEWDESSFKVMPLSISGGETAIDFTLDKAGYYRLIVETQDSKGRKISTSDTFYVTGEGFYLPASGIELHLDKKEYRVGDEAKILIVPPLSKKFPSLFAVEGQKIFRYQLLEGSEGPQEVTVPVTKDLVMGGYLSVTTFFDGNYYNESLELPIVPENELKIEITTDKEVYRPGEKGKVTVKVTGKDQKPRQCDLSLAVVDQAIFDISNEWLEDIYHHFYQNFYNRVSTQSSTYEYFYGQGEVVGNIKPQMKEGDGKGGGGEPVLRKYFPDTMLWLPNVQTDINGIYQGEFICPDNLSTWRVEVKAENVQEFGETVNTFKTSLPFAIRIEMPPFLTQGDFLKTQVTLWNEHVSQKVGIEAKSSPELLLGTYPREVIVKEKENLVFPLEVTAQKDGLSQLQIYARGEPDNDALEVSQPVFPQGVTVEQYTSAFATNGKAVLDFPVNPEQFSHVPAVEIQVFRNIESTLFRVMEDMYWYPYGCTEQTSSRMISLLALPVNETTNWVNDIPRVIREGIYQLYSLQHYDGGWGWWESDDSKVFNTAHALFALLVARKNGYPVSDATIENGKRYLSENLARESAQDQAFARVVLSRYGEKLPPINPQDFAKGWKEVEDSTIALLSMVTTGNLQQKIQQELVLRAQPAGDTVFFGHSTPEKYWEDTRFLDTCFAAWALKDINREMAGKAFLWLLRTVQSDQYTSTLEKAYFLNLALAFVEKPATDTGDFSVRLNERVLAQGQMDPKENSKTITLSPEQTQKGTNHLEVQGNGVYCATALVKGFSRTNLLSETLAVGKTYWKLKPVPLEDGTFVFAREPITVLVPGDEVVCEILVTSPVELDNLVIEDGLPAGFEFIRGDSAYRLQNVKEEEQIFPEKKIQNGQPVIFVYHIRAGENVIRYYLRVRDTGTFYVRPAKAYLMYFPEVRGYSKENVFQSGR